MAGEVFIARQDTLENVKRDTESILGYIEGQQILSRFKPVFAKKSSRVVVNKSDVSDCTNLLKIQGKLYATSDKSIYRINRDLYVEKTIKLPITSSIFYKGQIANSEEHIYVSSLSKIFKIDIKNMNIIAESMDLTNKRIENIILCNGFLYGLDRQLGNVPRILKIDCNTLNVVGQSKATDNNQFGTNILETDGVFIYLILGTDIIKMDAQTLQEVAKFTTALIGSNMAYIDNLIYCSNADFGGNNISILNPKTMTSIKQISKPMTDYANYFYDMGGYIYVTGTNNKILRINKTDFTFLIESGIGNSNFQTCFIPTFDDFSYLSICSGGDFSGKVVEIGETFIIESYRREF